MIHSFVMKKHYFRTSERVAALVNEVRTWDGTPFFARAAVRGEKGGVDCVNYCHEIMVATGAMQRASLPDYALDYAHHHPDSQLLRWLLDCPQLRGKLRLTPPACNHLPGDIIAIRSGMTDHHLAIVMPGDMVTHAIEDHGPVWHPLSQASFRERILYSFRILGT
jgi:hypothetical protein